MFWNLAGAETEFAVSGFENGRPMQHGELLSELFRHIATRYPSLPALSRAGFYCANGTHFYADCSKAEAATPEVEGPQDLVRYMKAIEVMMNHAAGEIEAKGRGTREVYVCRGNVDYSSDATWGSHESYQHRCAPAALHEVLLPHLVTRAIYAGSGGWRAMHGLEFTLSPRAAHVDKVISPDSTNGGRPGGRPILHAKDEPLTREGYHRLHLILGDSLYSEKAMLLRFGVTQLLVALVDAGGSAPAISLRNPVTALHTVAADTSCKARLPLTDGGKLTAVEVQRRYLEWVARHLPRLPEWAPRVAGLWAEILDALERDPMSLRGTLDWPFRLALYNDYGARHSCSIESVGRSTEALRRLRESTVGTAWQGQAVTLDFLIGPHSPVLKMAGHLTGEMRRAGQEWRDLRDHAQWEGRYFELDVKLGRIGPKGLFSVLDSAGLMPDHRVGEPRDIANACENPPAPGTRAHLRGNAIREVALSGRGNCEWDRVTDITRKRTLDLSDPLAREARWAEGATTSLFDRPPVRRSRALFDALSMRGLR
jgi:proteasome accessory factor A